MTQPLTWYKLSAEALEALANRDLNRAVALLGIQLDSFFSTDKATWMWHYRLNQTRQDSRTLDWIAQVAVLDDQVIGYAGFHGPPDADGVVEVAYSVVPFYRGRGYAKVMLHYLVQRAQADPAVKTVRASIRPDNAASLATIRPFPFVLVGEQWDEIDGLELIFDLAVKKACAPSL